MRKVHLTVPASEFSGHSSIESSPFTEDLPSQPVSFYIKEYQKLYKLLTLRNHSRTNTVRTNEDEFFQSPARINQPHTGWSNESMLLNSKSLMTIGDTSYTSDFSDLTPRNLERSYSPNLAIPSEKSGDLINKSVENLKNIISKCGKLPLNIQKAVELLVEKSNDIDQDSSQEEIIEAAIAIEVIKGKIINYLISQNDTQSFFENIIFASEKTAVELADRSRDDMVNLMKKKASIFEGNFSGKRKIQELYMFAIEIEKWKHGKLNPDSKYANRHPFQNQYEEILKQLKSQLEAEKGKGKKSGPNLNLKMMAIKKKIKEMREMNLELKKVVDYDSYLWKQLTGEKFKEFQKKRGNNDNQELIKENESLKIELYALYTKNESLYGIKEELQNEVEKCKQIIKDLASQIKLDNQKDEEIDYYLLKIESQDSLINQLEKKIESLKNCLSNRLPMVSSEIHALKNAAREIKGNLIKESRNWNSNCQNGTRIISIFLRKAMDENNQTKLANANLSGLLENQINDAKLQKKENEELKFSLIKASKAQEKLRTSLKYVLKTTESVKFSINDIKKLQNLQMKANSESLVLIKSKISEIARENKEKAEILRKSLTFQYHQSKLSVFRKACKIKESISESKSTVLAMKSEYSRKISDFIAHFNKTASAMVAQIKDKSIKISEELGSVKNERDIFKTRFSDASKEIELILIDKEKLKIAIEDKERETLKFAETNKRQSEELSKKQKEVELILEQMKIAKSREIDPAVVDGLKANNNELKDELSKVQKSKDWEILKITKEMQMIEKNLAESIKNRENEINMLAAENSELKIELSNYQQESSKIMQLINEEKENIEANLNSFIKRKEDEINELRIKYEELKNHESENEKIISKIKEENSTVLNYLTQKDAENEKLIEENQYLSEKALAKERGIQNMMMEKNKLEENLNITIKSKESEIVSYKEKSDSLKNEIFKLQKEKENDKELYTIECKKLEENHNKSIKSKENEITSLKEEIDTKRNEIKGNLTQIRNITNKSVLLVNELKDLKGYISGLKSSITTEMHNYLIEMQTILQMSISEKWTKNEEFNKLKIQMAIENEKSQYKILEKNKDCASEENQKFQQDIKKLEKINLYNLCQLKNIIGPQLNNLRSTNAQNKDSIISLQMEIVNSFKIFKKKFHRKVNEKTIKELETLEEVTELEKIVKAENFQFKDSSIIPQLTQVMENIVKENNSLIENFDSKTITLKDFRRNFVENVSSFYISVNNVLNEYSSKMVKEKEDLVSKINEIKTYYEIKLKEILRGGKSAIMVLNNGAAVIQKWCRRRRLRRTFDQYMNLIRMEPSKLLEMVDPSLVPIYGNHPRLRKCFRFAGEGWPPEILFNASILEEENEEEKEPKDK
ncbi:unnamed protein product [Blepharisma stoltei]|uniref:Uncharacterized protein n=1 Tax=Blepharisma stoltei TaxID=1481888 RepID=A0AAU9J6T3_9CILI|nr:unnamed protein product [Blepharisma stoltei]